MLTNLLRGMAKNKGGVRGETGKKENHKESRS